MTGTKKNCKFWEKWYSPPFVLDDFPIIQVLDDLSYYSREV